MTLHHPRQPSVRFCRPVMQSFTKFLFYSLQLGYLSFPFGFAHHCIFACMQATDVVGKTQEIKRPRLSPLRSFFILLQGVSTKTHQPGFIRVDFQAKLVQSLMQRCKAFPGVLMFLKTQSRIICVPYNHDITLCMLSAFFQPEIKAVVEINIRK